MSEALKVRLLREVAPPNPDGSTVRFGVQDKKGAMHDGVARGDGLTQFDVELNLTTAPDGSPDFGGPFVSGPPGERFVYLAWQRTNGAGFVNRIKVRLKDIDWPLISAVQTGGGSLEADLRGVSAGGGNRPVQWAIVAD